MSGAMATPPEPGQPPAVGTTSRPPARRALWTAVTIAVALLSLVGWLVVAKLVPFLTTPEGEPEVAPQAPVVATRKIAATLFYVTDDGAQLVPVSREVTYGATRNEQARRVVEAQVQAPPDGWASAIPAGTIVRAVFLAETGDAYVDLGGTFATGHPGGSLNEALAVYAIVNVVTTNLPDVRAVQILINGKEVETLAGHLDLRFPLTKSFDWIRKGQ
jgi:hypothetical protein